MIRIVVLNNAIGLNLLLKLNDAVILSLMLNITIWAEKSSVSSKGPPVLTSGTNEYALKWQRLFRYD